MFQSRGFLMMRMLVAVFVAVTSLCSSGAFAANTCESIFSAQKLVLKSKRTTIAGAIVATTARLMSPRFKIDRFDTALSKYRAGGVADRPRTREERVAFIHYLSEANGHSSIYDLEDWVHRASPKQLKMLGRVIGRFNTDAGLSSAKLHNIFWSLKTFSSESPYGWLKRARVGNDGMDRVALEQWATKEMTSHNAVDAAERLGFTPDPARRKRFRDWWAAHPNVREGIVVGAMMVFESTSWPGSPVSAPRFSRLQTTRIDPFLLKVVETQGFDFAYPYLKAEYGKALDFDRRFYFARQVVAAAMMGYMLSYMVPSVFNAVVPEPLRASGLPPGQITVEVVKHWILFAQLMRRTMSPDEEARRLAAAPHLRAATGAAPGTARPTAAVVGDDKKISSGRIAMTFDEQVSSKGPRARTGAVAGDPVSSSKDLDDMANDIDGMDFTDPTNR